MEKLALHIDEKAYSDKPKGGEVGKLSNRITSEVATVTVQELAERLGKGHTAVLAEFEGSRNTESFKSQQILALDFDNEDKHKERTTGLHYQTIEATLMNPTIQAYATFLYKTFSYKEGHEKFRVVFVLDEPLHSVKEVENAYDWLLFQFPNADQVVKDPTRIFFGGKQGYEEINFQNRLSTNLFPEIEIEEAPKVFSSKRPVNLIDKAKGIKANTTNSHKATWELIRDREYDEVKERWKPYSEAVSQPSQAIKYIKSLPMGEMLGLPEGVTFLDIFHDEEDPSANIYEDNKGVWFYKCFSSSAEFSGDLIRTLGKLTNQSYPISLAKELTGVEVKMSPKIKQLRDTWEEIMAVFSSVDFKINYPHMHNMFKSYKLEIQQIIDIFVKNQYEDSEGNIRSLTYIGTRTISEMLYGTPHKYKRIIKSLNLMNYTGWVDKLEYKEVPESLQVKIDKNIARNKEIFGHNRAMNVYELLGQEGSDEFFNQLEAQSILMREKGFSATSSLTYEGVAAMDGIDKARELFPQDSSREVSKKTKNFFNNLVVVVGTKLSEKAYVEQNEIMEILVDNFDYTKSYVERTYRKVYPALQEGYGFTKVRLTKDLKEQWDVPQSSSYPTVLYKSI